MALAGSIYTEGPFGQKKKPAKIYVTNVMKHS